MVDSAVLLLFAMLATAPPATAQQVQVDEVTVTTICVTACPEGVIPEPKAAKPSPGDTTVQWYNRAVFLVNHERVGWIDDSTEEIGICTRPCDEKDE